MSNLAQRLITAFIAIPIVFFLLWFNDFSRIGLMCFIAGVGAWEWAGMASKMYKGPDTRYLSFAASLALTLAWALSKGSYFGMPAVPYVVGMTFLVIFAIYIGLAYAKVEIDHLFPWLVMQLGAPLYVGLWGGMNVLMMGNGQGFEHCYPFILVMTGVWLCDTVAYFFGKFAAGKGPFGRHLFAPSISPKKTKAIGLGLLVTVAGQVGDLLMSALKRWSGTKDSGNLFVGHGGVLDRCDSFYLAAPALYLLMDFFQKLA